jgi:hypothetical protein
MKRSIPLLFLSLLSLLMGCDPGHNEVSPYVYKAPEGSQFTPPNYGFGPKFSVNQPMAPAGVEGVTDNPDVTKWGTFSFFFFYVPVDMKDTFVSELAATSWTTTLNIPSSKPKLPNKALSTSRALMIHSAPSLFYEFELDLSDPAKLKASSTDPYFNPGLQPIYDTYNSSGLRKTYDEVYEDQVTSGSIDPRYQLKAGDDCYLILVASFLGSGNNIGTTLYVPINHLGDPPMRTVKAGAHPGNS